MLKEVAVIGPIRPARRHCGPVGLDESDVGRDQRRNIQSQEVMLQVVKGDMPAVLAARQKSSAVQTEQQVAGSVLPHISGMPPQGADGRGRDDGVFGKYRQLEI